MKTLIIAEKPSVAADLARVLGKGPGMSKFVKEKDYFAVWGVVTNSVHKLC